MENSCSIMCSIWPVFMPLVHIVAPLTAPRGRRFGLVGRRSLGLAQKMAMGAMGAHPYGFRRTFAFGRYVAARDWKCGDWARCLSGGLLRRSCPEEGFAVWPLGFGAIMVLRVVH